MEKKWEQEAPSVGKKTLKNVLIPTGILLVGLLVALLFYFTAVQPAMQQPTMVQNSGQRPVGVYSKPLHPGQQMEQKFIVEGDEWFGFAFSIGTYGKAYEHITFTGEVVDAVTQETQAWFSEYLPVAADGQQVNVNFLKSLETTGNPLLLQVRLESAEDTPVAVWLLENKGLAPCLIEGAPQTGELWLQVQASSGFLHNYYWWVALPLVGLLVLLWVLVFVFEWKWKNIFLVAALGLGVLYMFVYPPYSMLDDSTHATTTFYHSSRLMGGDKVKDGTFENRAEDDMRGYVPTSPGRDQLNQTYKGLLEMEKNPGNTTTTEVSVFGQPYQYFPQALGVTIARLWGLGQVGTLHMGRLFSLLAYVGVLYFTLHITPIKLKPLFTLLGLLPFSLHTAGSFSYDISIISLCFLFVAYVLHITYDKERIALVDLIFLAVVGLLLAPLKYVYMPILLTIFLIPGAKWPRPWAKLVLGGGLVLAGAAFLVIYVNSAYAAGAEIMTAEVGTTPWNDPEGGYTYAGLLAQPAELVRLLFFSAVDKLDELVRAVGSFQFNTLPFWLCGLGWMLVLCSVLPVQGVPVLCFTKWQKAIMSVSSVAVYLLVLVAALPWTYIGSYYIRGAQGRYFIAFFPLVALLFYGNHLLQRKKDNSRALVYGMILINAYAAMGLLISAMSNRLPTTRL